MSPTRVCLVAATFTLSACTGEAEKLGNDTSTVGCDRVHGATGVAVLTHNGDSWHFPTEAPDAVNATTSIAGPLEDGSFLAVFGNQVLTSADAGCNWDDTGGRLPMGGIWDLVVGGATAWAFDRTSGQVGVSQDGGSSWTAADASEPFLGEVKVDTTGRLRGVQARGVVTSEDGGTTWTPGGAPPPGMPVAGAVFPGNLDVAAVAYSGGVQITQSAGASWTDISGKLLDDGFIAQNVAFATDDVNSIWVSGADAEFNTIYHTSNGGDDWKEVASSASIDLDAGAPLWPLPGVTTDTLSSWASVEDNFGVNLYHVVAGSNIHTSHVASTYFHLNDAAFVDSDTWLVAVDGIR